MASFKVDYFEIPVATTGKSSAFFEEAFGWTHADFGPNYVELREAGMLGGVNSDAADRSIAPLIGIRTDDIAAAERAIIASGGAISRAVYEYPGGKRLFFREPGGTEMLVYQPND